MQHVERENVRSSQVSTSQIVCVFCVALAGRDVPGTDHNEAECADAARSWE